MLQVNDEYIGEFNQKDICGNNSINYTYYDHNIELRGKSDTLSIRNAVNSQDGIFLNFILAEKEDTNSTNNNTDTGSIDDRQ